VRDRRGRRQEGERERGRNGREKVENRERKGTSGCSSNYCKYYALSTPYHQQISVSINNNLINVNCGKRSEGIDRTHMSNDSLLNVRFV
jgi:hypothetical protein